MTYDFDHIQDIVDIIVAKKTNHLRFFLLFGDLGVGKTTLVRFILEKIDIKELIISPTFTYINMYYSPLLKKKIYHLDLYRLSSLDEFYALGLNEFLEDPESLVFIEWPELIIPIIEKSFHFCEIFLQHTKEEHIRAITIQEK